MEPVSFKNSIRVSLFSTLRLREWMVSSQLDSDHNMEPWWDGIGLNDDFLL